MWFGYNHNHPNFIGPIIPRAAGSPPDPRNIGLPLPGLVQTNNRAELTAAIHAIKLGALEVYTDSMYVVKGIGKIR